MNCNLELDARDRELVQLLEANGRMPVSELARRLALSRTAVQNRIDRLLRHGVIDGFTIRSRAANPGIEAIVEVMLADGERTNLRREIAHRSEVRRIWSTAGNPDSFVLVEAASLDALHKVAELIASSPGVVRITTHIVLERALSRP